MNYLVFFLFAFCFSEETGRITTLLTNGISKPIGYNFSSLSLSWIVESSAAKLEATKVRIALDESFDNIIYNTKYQADISSLDFSPDISLSPRTRYFWCVSVKTDLNETIKSDITYFETGKIDEKWAADWITSSISQTEPQYFRKTFKIYGKASLSQARVYISALGLYELYINNEKVSKEHFTPYCTGYKYWLQYQTYDVSKYLQEGENVIGVLIGDGWAKGHFWFSKEPADMTMESNELGFPVNITIDQYLLICELRMNDQILVMSDKSWTCHLSPVRRSNFYDGEVYDCNYEIPNWSSPQYVENDWENAVVVYEYQQECPFTLSERLSVPVIVKKRFEPKRIIDTDVVDIGQNIAGWVEITIDAPKNFETILEFGEIYTKAEFDNSNLGSAQQEFRIISNGNKTRVRPHFTYFGFQYIRFKQFYGPQEPNFIKSFDITVCAIYSDLEETGSFECGSEDVNKYFSNAFWSQRSNFVDVPTDCPQRDERLGWTGDAQIFCSTAMYNMRSYPFYRKYLKDLYLLQLNSFANLSGAVSSIVPFFGENEEEQMAGRAGWGDAATIIPFKLYEHTGRKQILREQIQSMKMWIDYVQSEMASTSTSKMDEGIWKAAKEQFGDWLALDRRPKEKTGRTDATFICSCYAYYSLYCFINSLKAINEDEQVIKSYEEKMELTLQNIRQNYVTPSGRIVIQTQTAQALGLYLNLSHKPTVVLLTLKKILRDNDNKIDTGFIGTPILHRSLADNGDPHTAYTVFLNPKYPGCLYQVQTGATSIWESWDAISENGAIKSSPNSMNHYAPGSIVEWLYRNVCGIQPLFSNPGFKEFNLWPQPDIRLRYANCTVNTSMGTIKSRWTVYYNEAFAKRVKYEFSVPFNTVAHVKLINTNVKKVDAFYKPHSFSQESSRKFQDVKKLLKLRQTGDDVTVNLGSGVYIFDTPYHDHEIPINIQFF